MKLFLRILILCVLAGVLVISAVMLRRPPDPVFEGKHVSAWLEQCLSSNFTERNDARTALLVLGEPALPQIRTYLRKRNAGWEPFAAKVCQKVPFLQFKVLDAVACRESAANLVTEMGPKAKVVIPDLVDALEFEAGRETVTRALRRMGSEAEAELRKGLRADPERVREGCATLLGELKSVERKTVESLRAALNDSSANVRAASALTIGMVNAVDVQEVLAKVLQEDASAQVRARSAEALGKLKQVSERAVVALKEKMLGDSEGEVRFQCAKSLWVHRGQPEMVLQTLISLLPGEEGWKATYLLGQMGSHAAPAVPALIEVLKREQVPRPFRTPPSSAFALGQIGPAALPNLFPILINGNPRARLSAIVAIGFMGTRGASAALNILPLLKDERIEIRHGAAMALGQIGAKNDEVIAGLESCLGDEDIYLRSAAADLLRKIAPEREWVVLAE